MKFTETRVRANFAAITGLILLGGITCVSAQEYYIEIQNNQFFSQTTSGISTFTNANLLVRVNDTNTTGQNLIPGSTSTAISALPAGSTGAAPIALPDVSGSTGTPSTFVRVVSSGFGPTRAQWEATYLPGTYTLSLDTNAGTNAEPVSFFGSAGTVAPTLTNGGFVGGALQINTLSSFLLQWDAWDLPAADTRAIQLTFGGTVAGPNIVLSGSSTQYELAAGSLLAGASYSLEFNFIRASDFSNGEDSDIRNRSQHTVIVPIAVVPEPTTTAFLFGSLVMFAAVMRRRHRNQ